jgi:tRNA 2-selenouridine synthase
MPIQKIAIEQFLSLSREHPVLDVRSPGEYTHAHVPGAHSLPLFSDEERKIVGTTYKQQSREAAIKIGLDFFGVKMRKMVEEVEEIVGSMQYAVGNGKHPESKLQTANCILLHCWRGGMRSAAIAWLLDLYGFKVYMLVGGYKAYRKWVLAQFEKEYEFKIIGGYTGSGKTLLLRELEKQGQTIIDLEAIANHKGSAFGALGEKEQSKQEMFENILASELSGQWAVSGQPLPTANCQPPTANCQLSTANCIWLEDESQRIGNLQIPMPLWYTMRKSPVYFLDIPFEERLKYITEEYGKFEKEKLVNAIIRIQKRLGGLETKNAINHLIENDHKACFRILLTYYDKWYGKALHNRENIAVLLNKMTCAGVDTAANTQKLLSCLTVASL